MNFTSFFNTVASSYFNMLYVGTELWRAYWNCHIIKPTIYNGKTIELSIVGLQWTIVILGRQLYYIILITVHGLTSYSAEFYLNKIPYVLFTYT